MNIQNKVTVLWNDRVELWSVVKNGRVTSRHRLKQTAEKEGRKEAKSSKPSKYVIERKDGGVSYQQLYGV